MSGDDTRALAVIGGGRREPGEPLVITDAIMAEGLKRAADAARKQERAAQVKARDAALDAMAQSHEAEVTRLNEAHLTAREEYAVHRVVAARWFNLGLGLFVGGIAASSLTFLLMRGAMTTGIDAGIEASAKSRIIDRSFQRADEAIGNYAPCGEEGASPNCPRVGEPRR